MGMRLRAAIYFLIIAIPVAAAIIVAIARPSPVLWALVTYLFVLLAVSLAVVLRNALVRDEGQGDGLQATGDLSRGSKSCFAQRI